MSETTLPPDDPITQHVEWLRRIARSLVRDADAAEDLAQDTVVRALERPPTETVHSVRAWLGTVLRNLAKERFRSDSRRRARERTAARPESSRPSDDEPASHVEQLRAQRNLTDALLKLDEPYRSTLMLRFYEGLPPRKIAKRQDVPVTTVKSRLHRGLAKLRTHLDRDYDGDRRAWVVALIPLAGHLGPVASLAATAKAATGTTTLGWIMNTKLWTAAAAGLTLLFAGSYWFGDEHDGPQDSGSSLLVDVRDAGARATTATDTDAALGEVAIPTRVRVDGREREVEPTTWFSGRGRILDSDGRGVPGIGVRAAGDAENSLLATSAADGFFEFETTRETLRLEATAPAVDSNDGPDSDWVTVRAGAWRHDATIEPIVIAARALELGGRVIDERGDPVSGAKLLFALPADFRTRFRDVVDATYQPTWSSASADDGSFAMPTLPAIFGASLRVVCDGFRIAVVDAPPVSLDHFEVQLARNTVEAGALAVQGRVLREDGMPASAARVVAGFSMVRTNDEGFFALDRGRVGDAETITAVEAGSQPGETPVPDADSSDFVVIRLGAETLSLTAEVTNAEGDPVVGARVLLADPTRFGVMGMLPLQSEALAAGTKLPALALESANWSLNRYEHATGSARPALESNAMLGWQRTDNEGRVTIGGLSDRPYRLRIVDEDLRFSHVSKPLQPSPQPGNTHLVRVPTPEAWPEVRGRVVTRLGDPVPGVRIIPYLPVLRERVGVPGGSANVTRWFQADSMVTDEDGTFVMRNVPKAELQFYLISDQILPVYAGVEGIDDPTDVVVPVEARTHLEVEITDGSADAIRVRGFDEKPIRILRMRADGHTDDGVLELERGKSGVVTITSTAAWLDLIRDGEVVDTLPLEPRPGVVQRVTR